MSWTLCSKADVISIHPITEAALPDLWSDAVEQLIREHLSKPGLGLAQVEVTESYSGDETPVLILRHLPIISVSCLSIDEEDIPAADYIINKTSIQLTGERVFTEGNLNVSVRYLSGGGVDENGLITDPLVRLTAAAMVVAIANYKGRAGADSSLKWGNADQKEGNSTATFDIGLTSHLRKIMKNMLRRSRLRIK
jgi:hypothetical protein